MTRCARLLLLLALLLPAWARADADLVLVVNAKSGVDRLTQEEAVNIFMGRYRQLPSGIPAVPIDQPDTQPEKALFYRLLVNKDLAEINAYWARLLFSGRTSPPHQAKSAAEALDLLARQRGAIGYIERSQVDARVKIVLDLGR
ncbi:hypothetical protein EZJ19_03825 [Parasulfuritortus cantonensis]|uniref:Phosphate ABC transporter substrate-binding protein n=1 Tax=Parasulfuritortus cantonensis TaxID=2528202 RepID=A0A4R1BKZ6_9PROT|nr:hypothetical protein [Parasulfuritortus cantonensis]TCJ18043.1 hypothetical protein EZJ19_03825 [Parasulfuritortus cantonensis]